MIRHASSIRVRLSVYAIIVVASTVTLTWIGLTLLFECHIERRGRQELGANLEQIVGGLRLLADGTARLSRDLANPRFGNFLAGFITRLPRRTNRC